MNKAWTIKDDEFGARTDIVLVTADTKEDALEAIRQELQKDDDYWTYIIINGSIYKFTPGDGYKGAEFDCDDRNPDMWDIDTSSGSYNLAELPCYYMGDEYDVEDFIKSHDVIKTLNRNTFKSKFSGTSNYPYVLMNESSSEVAAYLDNGTVLLHSDWNGECYCSDGKNHYYPVEIPISYCYDEDDEEGYGQPDQYETVGYILETY